MIMHDKIHEIDGKIAVLRAEKKLLDERIEKCDKKAREQRERQENAAKAREFIQHVANLTQDKLELQLSTLVTTALQAIFPDEKYTFKVQFVARRNQTECDLVLLNDGKESDPLEDSGGVADVVSFALRMSFLGLVDSRPIIILDEPFKFMSITSHQRCSDMLKMLSDRLGVQIIMVTHLEELIKSADKVFNVSHGVVTQRK